MVYYTTLIIGMKKEKEKKRSIPINNITILKRIRTIQNKQNNTSERKHKTQLKKNEYHS